MPDILVRHIEDGMADRIKELARQRDWSLNDVVLHALRYGLGLSGSGPVAPEHDIHDIARLSGTWAPDEAAALQDAIDALAQTRPEQLLATSHEDDG